MATTDQSSEEVKQDTDTTEQPSQEAKQYMHMDTTDSETDTLEIQQDPKGTLEAPTSPSEDTQTSEPPHTESGTSPPVEETPQAEAISPESPTEQAVVSKESDTAPPPPPPPPSSPEVLFQPDWAPTVSRDVVIDRIRGCIYGNALGDAMGLATEFLSKDEAKKKYPGTGPIPFSKIAQDFHRYRWKIGDWTDDTDQMLLIMDGIIESGGKVLATDFAHKLLRWSREGYAELGDTGGMGIGMTVHRTISHSCFTTEPHTAAREVWEESGKYLAANGAVMRTSVLGIVSFNNLDTVARNTLQISLATHTDPRCSASCVAVTTLIAQLLASGVKTDLSAIIDKSIQEGAKYIEDEDKKKEFIEHMRAKSLQTLNLDEAKAIGYTFKCAGTAFVGLNSKIKNEKDFIKFMTELVREAGDADTNGAVCGAVIGAKIGYSNLPQEWLQDMPHIKWLDCRVEKFLACIGLGPESSTS